MKATAFGHGGRSARLAFAVLAIFALALFPLRAWCGPGWASGAPAAGARHVGHGDAKSGLCCASAEGRVLINDSVAPPSVKAVGGNALVAATAAAPVPSGLAPRRSRPAGAPPPPPSSYYARSARLLR